MLYINENKGNVFKSTYFQILSRECNTILLKLTMEESKYYQLNLLYLNKNQNNVLTWLLRFRLWCIRSYFFHNIG